MNRPRSRVSGSHIVVVVAVLLGAALRWHHLGWENVWLDEAYSIDLARGSLSRILAERWTDIHPPLYYISLHYWIPVAGYSEAGARLLSAIFDLGAIVATYAVAVPLVGSAAGAAAALLVAVSPFHIEFAQEARMYALLGLTSTLSMRAFVELTRARRPVTVASYIAATTLLLYTHIYSLFILAAQATTVVLWWWRSNDGEDRRGVVAWIAALAGVLLLYSPWVAVLVNQATRVHAAFWIARPTWRDGVSVFATYAGSENLGLIAGGLALTAAALLSRSRPAVSRGPASMLVLAPWLVMPVLLPLLASWIATPIFLPKYTIAASIPFAILAGYGLMRLPDVLRSPLMVTVGILSIATLTTFYDARRREGWKNAVATLESLARPNDVVLFYPWFNQYPFDYYRTRTDLIAVGFPLEPMVPIPDPEPLGVMLRETTGEGRRVWLVALQGAKERIPIAAGLARERTQTQHIVAEWLEVDLFDRGQ